MKDDLVIQISPHSEGGLNYDIWKDATIDSIVKNDLCSDDGGICTSGCHDEGCKNLDCPGCEEAMSKPYTREDWKNALEMAAEQALDLMFPDETNKG